MIRVLLVEDHFPDAFLLTEWLEKAGADWEVEHVETFTDAMERWQEAPYDALLLDLDIPDGFGLEVLSRGLALVGDCPVVVLSGLENPVVAAGAMALGARAYVVKGPAAVPTLLAVLPGG